MGSIPGLGRSPGGGDGNPVQYSCLEIERRAGGLQSMGLQSVQHDFVAEQQQDCSTSYYGLLNHLFNLFCEMSVQVLPIFKLCFLYSIFKPFYLFIFGCIGF